MQERDMDIPLTYYGNGCSPATGSSEPCSTRIVQTYDNEDQKNGTYYYAYAATSGSGGTALTKDNTNTPDTFCPLGWQLLYGGTGGDYYDKSKSWNYLLSSYHLENNQTSSQKLRSYPLSWVQSGGLDGYQGKLYNQSTSGLYWTMTNKDDIHTYRVSYWASQIPSLVGESIAKWYAYTLRCTPDLSVLTIIKIQLILKS